MTTAKAPALKIAQLVEGLKQLGRSVEKLGRKNGKTGPYTYKVEGAVYTLAELRDYFTALTVPGVSFPAEPEVTETETETEVEVAETEVEVEVPEVEVEYDFDSEYGYDEGDVDYEDGEGFAFTSEQITTVIEGMARVATTV